MVGNEAIAVMASSRGFWSRPRLSIGAHIRRASMGADLAAAAACRTSIAARERVRRSARSRAKRTCSDGSGIRPCKSRYATASKLAHGARSSTAYPAMVSRPASPSTWLSRVDAATTPSSPSLMSLMLWETVRLVNIDYKINLMKAGTYYLTARQAADALAITLATLYAYTSRGQLRSEPVSGRRRERRYYREDVERLKARKEARRDPSKAAAQGLHWGGPVMESGITLIHNGRFYYRGHDATKLAETTSAEQVAALLWEAEEPERRSVVRATVRAESPPVGAAATLRQGAFHLAAGGAADCGSRRPGVLRSPPGSGATDRRSHYSAVDDCRRAPRRAWSCSPGSTGGLGAKERCGRRRDPNGAGPLCRPRAERLGLHRQVRGFGWRFAL